MRQRALWVLAGLVLAAPAAVRADVKPHGICSEGMVLQQKAGAKIWGTAAKDESVTVAFRDQKVTTKADGQGNWEVILKTGEAGGPFEMTIAGKNEIHYKNILVGEVWVCSGQSNMEWSVGGCDQSDKDYAYQAPHNANLRIFHVKKTPSVWPLSDTSGTWTEADPKVLANWTAAGYFFGRDLQEKLKVPVGLIQSAWGGTRAEAWTSPQALMAEPGYSTEIGGWLTRLATTPDARALNANSPAALYNGMIYPILNYRIQGAIWYQGESNAGRAYAYRTLFPMMIDDWRKQWKQPDFPFYFVQLAPFTSVRKDPGPSAWAELREAQLMTTKLKNCGMAVITDYGNEYDIHPTPKRPVGERLALLARARTYGEKVEDSGPEYKSVKIDGTKAILSFSHIGGGLVGLEMVPTLERKNAKTGAMAAAWRVKNQSEGAPLVGFTIAGKDQKFQPAKAEIAGDTVVVTSEAVADPVAVRYGWADHPVCNLFNRAGLPATPFRTDDFPAMTAPKQ
jgi:sialate O-acetylesterase